MDIYSIILPIAVATWVFYDARGLGVKRGQPPGFLSASPAGWSIGCFLFLIIVLPIYLIKRVEYKRLYNERLMHEADFAGPDYGDAEVWPPPPENPSE